MATVPAFSHFSAISELFVTAAVSYVLWQAWRHDRFRGALLATVLAFEALVNMSYMTLRFVDPSPTLSASSGASWLMAGHGILSLLMFAGLVTFALEGRRLHKEGRNVVRERPKATVAFAALWGLSIASGEALYLIQVLR